jgi:PBSX family phage terminase large subunit
MTKIKKKIYKPSEKSKLVWRSFGLAKYTILEGAVRSSKSYTANFLAIKHIQELPPCDILISGYTITSVARNVLAEWKRIIDPKNNGLFRTVKGDKDEYLTINWRGLKDKKFYIRGAGTESDYKQIQGATFGFWLADEATRHTESFIDMAISRMSLDYSKVIWTLNPDSPFHFIKKRFIDDPDKYKVHDDGFRLFQRFHYNLEDNASLSKRVIDEYKTQYTGVFYDRYILGKWAIAEGLIYPNFAEEEHTYWTDDRPSIKDWYISVDYGTQNPCVFLKMGLGFHRKTREVTYYCDDEYYYCGRDENKQKTDSQYADDMDEFTNYKYPTVYCDPSAASFIAELTSRGYNVVPADNAVDDGIRLQSRMISDSKYYINKRCTNTIREYAQYSWDKRKAEKTGIDAPIKINDHCKDAERYFFSSYVGIKPVIDYSKLW